MYELYEVFNSAPTKVIAGVDADIKLLEAQVQEKKMQANKKLKLIAELRALERENLCQTAQVANSEKIAKQQIIIGGGGGGGSGVVGVSSNSVGGINPQLLGAMNFAGGASHVPFPPIQYAAAPLPTLSSSSNFNFAHFFAEHTINEAYRKAQLDAEAAERFRQHQLSTMQLQYLYSKLTSS